MKRVACKPAKGLIWLAMVPFTLALTHALTALFYSVSNQQIPQSLDQTFANVWQGLVFLIVILAIADYFAARRVPKLKFSRTNKEVLSLHRWAEITVNIDGEHLEKPIDIDLKELADLTLELSDEALQTHVKPQHTTQISYKVRPSRRGDALLDGLHLLVKSDLRLWRSVWQVPEQTVLKVYPDFQAISGYTLLAQDNNVSQFGIKHKPRRGQGMEFHQLREYQKGDTSRQIDWKATSRKQKIISRDYQDERDQQIIILLDNGRRMRTEDEKLGHLDHSINAMSLLSHIALKQGDAVGLMTFGQDQRWLPCQKGTAHINTILNHVYDLQPGVHATDYSSAAQRLIQLQRKRSLVILITNTRDEDIDDLLPAIRLVGRHHLILLANIREPVLKKTLDAPVNDLESAYRYVGTVDYLNRRQKTLQQLSDAGVFMLDSDPEQLPIDVCNGYLSIKRSGVL